MSEPFDPDAFLATPAPPAAKPFDPDEFLKAAGPELEGDAHTEHGPGHDVYEHVDTWKDKARAFLNPLLLGHAGQIAAAQRYDGSPGSIQRMHQVEAEENAKNDEAEKNHRGWSLAGALSMPVPGAPEFKAAGKLAPLARVAYSSGLGATFGALAGNDKRPLAERAEMGAAAGGAGGVLGEVVGLLPKTLRWAGLGQGKRVLTGGAEPLSVKKEIPDAVVEAAVEHGIIRPFGTTSGAAKRAGPVVEAAGQKLGKVVDELHAKGVTGPDATQLGLELLSEGERAALVRDPAMASRFAREGEAMGRMPTSPSGKLDLKHAEEIKRSYQAQARNQFDKIQRTHSPKGLADLALAAKMNAANEAAIAAQAAKAPEAAAAFGPAKENFGRVAQAQELLDKASGQASRRNTFGIRDLMAAGVMGGGEALRGGGGLGSLAAAAAGAVGTHIARTRLPSTFAALGLPAARLADPLAREASARLVSRWLQHAGKKDAGADGAEGDAPLLAGP